MKRAAAALLALALLLTGCGTRSSFSAPAVTPPLPSPPLPATAAPWEELPVYVDGLLRGRTYRHEGTVYLDPALLCELFGLRMALTLGAEDYSLELPGVTVHGRRGQDYAQADSRYLYTPGGYLSREGRLYLPCQAAAILFGADVRLETEPLRVMLDSGVCSPMVDSGGDYYLLHYPTEDLYWLSQIIQAEADTEPLAGQIAVGNVVLNRVKSPLFPDSIREVVTQFQGGQYQFAAMSEENIRRPAEDPCVLAACLCLEGFNTAGESLYFLNPLYADSTWLEATRQFYTRIGAHDFYL